MGKYGLLIDYDYCTGCLSCEVACQQEHDYPPGRNGIRVTEFEYETPAGLAIDYLPYPTSLCDLCIRRQKEKALPACVKHCQSRCMRFGLLRDLSREMEARPRTVLYSPR